jgi:hypothetical protein
MTADHRSDAPWTDEEVSSLNDYQTKSGMHPFTCGVKSSHGKGYLVATIEGWLCPEPHCDYTQTWAHKEMADGSWREWESARREYLLAHRDDIDDWGDSL